MRRAKNLWKDRSGVAMIAAMAVIIIVTILATAMFHISTSELRLTTKNEAYEKASYLARSGVEAVVSSFDKLDDSTKTQMKAGGTTAKDTITTDPLWLCSDGKTIVCQASAPDGALGQASGEVKVVSEQNAKGEDQEYYQFRCTATISGTSATKTAVYARRETYTANTRGWYNDDGSLKKGTGIGSTPAAFTDIFPNANGSLGGGNATQWVVSELNSGEDVVMTGSEAVNLHFANGNQNELIQWTADKIIINLPVDLSESGFGNGGNVVKVFCMKSKAVLFREKVTLYVNAASGGTDVGTIVFLAKDATDASYSMAFEKGLYLNLTNNGVSTTMQLVAPGKAYKFDETHNTALAGIDLLRYFVQTSGNDPQKFSSSTSLSQMVTVNAAGAAKNPYGYNGYWQTTAASDGGYQAWPGSWSTKYSGGQDRMCLVTNRTSSITVYNKNGTEVTGTWYKNAGGYYCFVPNQEEYVNQTLYYRYYSMGWYRLGTLTGKWKTETVYGKNETPNYIWTPDSGTLTDVSQLYYYYYYWGSRYRLVTDKKTASVSNGTLVTKDDDLYGKTLYRYVPQSTGGTNWIAPTDPPFTLYHAGGDAGQELENIEDVGKLIDGILYQEKDTVYEGLIWR